CFTWKLPTLLVESAQLQCELHCSSFFPGHIKTVVLSYEKIRLDIPYTQEIVQSCLQETLQYFYRILTNREDTDFVLKDIGTLSIRGKGVKMTFSKEFLLGLNKSTYVVKKLLAVSLLFLLRYLERV
ncbi:CCD81 protein, partial [Anseranas semipalmata]|nr:CCD81 protein [Anseranas semipalmata]